MSVVIVAVVLAGSGLLMRWFMRNAFAASPKGVLRRLEKSRTVRLRLSGTDGVWNPSKTLGIDNQIFGPGVATYWQDESGTVHLEIRVRNGQLHKMEGPVPEILVHPTQAARRSRKVLRAALVGYLVVCLAGLVVGLLVAGNGGVDRFVGASVGLLVAMALALIGMTALRVASSVRSLTGKSSPDSSQHVKPS
jgi:hypothetical protein